MVNHVGRQARGIIRLDSDAMAYPAHPRAKPRRHIGRSPLTAPLLLFATPRLTAAVYVTYVLWPRWPDAPVGLDAPSLPIVIAGVGFNIEPAAIRIPVQRRAGTEERCDVAHLL